MNLQQTAIELIAVHILFACLPRFGHIL